jgi:c-di-GMP-binding flagellar brake protein YcgR
MISTVTSVTDTRIKIVSKAVNATRNVNVRATSNDVYIGGADVTSANGLPLRQHESIIVVIPPNEELWAITSSGTHTIATLTNFVSLA